MKGNLLPTKEQAAKLAEKKHHYKKTIAYSLNT